MSLGRKAILAVSFGTTHLDSLDAAIGAVERRIGSENPGYEVRRAFTSSIIVKKLNGRGFQVDGVDAAVKRIRDQGFSELVVQPLHLIPGDEFEKMLAELAPHRSAFARVAVGRPLFDGEGGYRAVLDAVMSGFPRLDPGEALVLMGHGTGHPSDAAYSRIQATLDAMGLPVHVGTVEGAVTLDDAMARLRSARVAKVIVAPLMLVAGDHAKNDMAGDEPDSWASRLRAEGFAVRIVMRGIGELPAVQAIYADRVKAAIDGSPGAA